MTCQRLAYLHALPFAQVSLVFQPNDPCTLNGCGFSNAATVYSQQVAAYQNAHPRVGYQLKPMPCTGGCSTPYEDSVSVTGTPPALPSSYLLVCLVLAGRHLTVRCAGRDIRYIELVSVPEDQLFNQYPADIPVEFRTGSSALIWFMSARSGAATLTSPPTALPAHSFILQLCSMMPAHTQRSRGRWTARRPAPTCSPSRARWRAFAPCRC